MKEQETWQSRSRHHIPSRRDRRGSLRDRSRASFNRQERRAAKQTAPDKDHEASMATDLKNVLREEAHQCLLVADMTTDPTIKQALIAIANRLQAAADSKDDEQ
jgi:hypothetical protein